MPDTQNIAAAWQKRSNWLARWTLAHMVNRTDLWGRYLAKDKRKTTEGGQTILSRLAPFESKRGSIQLTEHSLARHYRGEDPGHILGVHSASSGNTSRWIAIDLETHHEQVIPINSLRAATHWRDELIAMGFRPLLIDSDGKGGYHLLVLFRQPLPTAKAYEFAQTLVRDHTDLGLAHAPVVLPNGPVFDENSWLRLPGRHPITDHWSRVWNGRRWLEGSDAVEGLLHSHGDSSTLIRKLTATAAIAGSSPDGAIPAAAAIEALQRGSSPPKILSRQSIGGVMVTQVPTPVSPAQPASVPLPQGPVLERQILSYLLSATRQSQETAAFAAVAAADVSAEAFKTPVHRQIFTAMQNLYGKSERITPTEISENMPQEDRAESLRVIDQIILEKPVDEDQFEDLLEALACQSTQTPAPAPSAPAPTGLPPTVTIAASSDPELESFIQSWLCMAPPIRQAILTLAQAAAKPK